MKRKFQTHADKEGGTGEAGSSVTGVKCSREVTGEDGIGREKQGRGKMQGRYVKVAGRGSRGMETCDRVKVRQEISMVG